MVVDHHLESVHRRALNFENLLHFAMSTEELFRARLRLITNTVTSHQQGRSLAHVGSNRTILRRRRATNRPPASNVNLMYSREGVHEEDILEIEECAQPTTVVKWTTEPVQQFDEQRGLFYPDKPDRLTPQPSPSHTIRAGSRLHWTVKLPVSFWTDFCSRKIIFH